MSVQLLDKTRKINKLLHNNHSDRVEFNDICEVLSGILESNIMVISQKGKILGAAVYSGIDKIGELITADVGGFVDGDIFGWDYSVYSGAEQIMYVSKELLHLTDTYVIDVYDDSNALAGLLIALAIDAEKCSDGN